MKTFKEYLIEYDRSDIELQQQHGGMQQTAQQQQQQRPERSEFQQKMGQQPQKGDIIENKAGRFAVVGGSMKGLVVKQAGTGKTFTLPHGMKFQAAGQDASGRTVFNQTQ